MVYNKRDKSEKSVKDGKQIKKDNYYKKKME